METMKPPLGLCEMFEFQLVICLKIYRKIVCNIKKSNLLTRNWSFTHKAYEVAALAAF